jgi:hypothetical protein
MNLNYGLALGSCVPADRACQAYTYGYLAARNAMAYAATQHVTAGVWWLDIELGNTWSSNTALNAQVIAGAVAYLHAQGRIAGIYCTPYQWGVIAGSFAPHLPEWSAGAPTSNPGSYCTASHAFGGGTIWLTQYANGNYDGDWSC